MAVNFSFTRADGNVESAICSDLDKDKAHRILSAAHFSETGTLMLNHDAGTDIFNIGQYQRVNFREVTA